MKHIIIVIIFCLTNSMLFAQNIQRSSLGLSSSTIEVTTIETTYYVSHSIGQNSIIGTFTNNTNTIRQGFQQPPFQVEIYPDKNNNLIATIFPNPINTQVNVLFNELPTTSIDVKMFDITGRTVYHNFQSPINRFSIDVSRFSNGVYLLNINSGAKQFTTRLIKK